jgi:hypothetical protein
MPLSKTKPNQFLPPRSVPHHSRAGMTHNFDVTLSNVRLRLHLGLTGACVATSSSSSSSESAGDASSDACSVLIPPCVGTTNACLESDAGDGEGRDIGDGGSGRGIVSLDPAKLVLNFNIVTQEQPLQFNLNDGSVQRQFVRTGSTQGQALEYAWAGTRARKYATNYNISEVFHCRAIFVELRQQLGWGTSEVILSKEISLWKASTGVSSYNVTLNQVVHQNKAMTFRAEVSFQLYFEPVCRSLHLSLVDVVPGALRLSDWCRALGLPVNHSFVLRARYLDPNVVKQVKGNLQHKSLRGCEVRLNESTAVLQNFIIDFPGTVPMRALRASCLFFTLETVLPAQRLAQEAPTPTPTPTPKLQRRSSLHRLLDGDSGGGGAAEGSTALLLPGHHRTASSHALPPVEKAKPTSAVIACAKVPVLFDYCPDDARTHLSLEWNVRREMLQAFPTLLQLAHSAPRLEAELIIANGPPLCQMRNGHYTDAGIVSGQFCAEFPRPTQAQLALSFRDAREHAIFSCTSYHLEWSQSIGLMKDCVLSAAQQAAETPEVMLEHELRNRSQSRALSQQCKPAAGIDGPVPTVSPSEASTSQRNVAGALLFAFPSHDDDGGDGDGDDGDGNNDRGEEQRQVSLSSRLQFATALTRAPRFWEYWLHSIRERNGGDRTLRTNWVAWQHAAREWRNRNRDTHARSMASPVEYFLQNRGTHERLQGYADVFMHHLHVAICKANKAAALEPSPGKGERDARRRPHVSIYRFLPRASVPVPPPPLNKDNAATRA